MSNKVALITFHTGFNYGTSLQAYAMNELTKEVGYEPIIIWHNDGLIKGRDITISKVFIMMVRYILHPSASKKAIAAYKDTYSYKLTDETKNKFLLFEKHFLNIKKMNYNKMKQLCASKEIKAVCCGSDQIWKANLLYLSPYYFLRFAPKNKRIAYAPSFGAMEVPAYNKKILAKYLKDFSSISVREETGVKIIKDLIKKDCFVALDPTLAVNTEIWRKFIKEEKSNDYILCYFLDAPTEKVLENIQFVQKKSNLSIKIIPYVYDCFSEFKKSSFENAGPIEFLNLVYNAKIIFTDSFHCSVFSVLYEKPFFIFERNHKKAISGNTRIENFVKLTNLQERYIKNDFSIDFTNVFNCDFSVAKKNIEVKREQSLEFLKSAISEVNVGK